MVTTFYPPYHFGGDGVHVYRLTEALAEQGHAVDVVHSEDAYRLQNRDEPAIAFQHHPNVTVHGLRTARPGLGAVAAHQLGRPALYARDLRAVLAPGRFDVIHFHNVSLMGAPGVLKLGDAVKLYTANEYWLICATHVLFAFDREACTERRCLACTLAYHRPPQAWRYTGALPRALEHVDCLLMPSRFALDQHRAQGIRRPMVHLPHFVVPTPPVDDEAAPNQGRPYFLFVGRLERLKGVHDLIRLFSSYREADLLIVGSGFEGPALQREAAALTNVKFLGSVHPSSLSALYREAIAVLVPSLCYETFGLTVAEAAVQGTPAVVRRIGALRENVEETGAGLTFETQDELRAALERLRSEPGLRARLGEAGRRAAREKWSLEAHLSRYLSVVEKLRAGEAVGDEAGALLAGRALRGDVA